MAIKTHPKTLLILRGLPGSGKSRLAGLLRALTGCAIHSLDEYRVVDGEYKFDPSREKEVVQKYKGAFKNSIEIGERLIIIDNCNSREWEYLHEYVRAEDAGYMVHLVEVQAELDECMERQSHSIPANKMQEIFSRWENPFMPTRRLNRIEKIMLDVLQNKRAKKLKADADSKWKKKPKPLKMVKEDQETDG